MTIIILPVSSLAEQWSAEGATSGINQQCPVYSWQMTWCSESLNKLRGLGRVMLVM